MTLQDEAERRWDYGMPKEITHARRAGCSVNRIQINRAQRQLERLETYLADPDLSEIDRCFYKGKLGVWRDHLDRLLADEANETLAAE